MGSAVCAEVLDWPPFWVYDAQEGIATFGLEPKDLREWGLRRDGHGWFLVETLGIAALWLRCWRALL
eukprot:7886485-Alexandrium_andersonii.AAC.1